MLNLAASDGTAPNQTLKPDADGDAECLQFGRRLHLGLLRVLVLFIAQFHQHLLLPTQETTATALQCLRDEGKEAVIIIFEVY